MSSRVASSDVAAGWVATTIASGLSEGDDELRRESGGALLGGIVGAVREGGGAAHADRAIAGDERGDVDLVPGAHGDRSQRGEDGRVERRGGVPGHRPLAPGARVEHPMEVASPAGGVDAVEP